MGLTRRRAVFVGLVLAIGVAVAVVGFHAHSHSHGDLRVIDAEGNVQVVGAWRLGSAAGGELPTVASGDLRFELSNADGVRHSFVVVRTELEGTDLPVSGGRVDLEQAGELVGTVETVLPGGTEGAHIQSAAGSLRALLRHRGSLRGGHALHASGGGEHRSMTGSGRLLRARDARLRESARRYSHARLLRARDARLGRALAAPRLR